MQGSNENKLSTDEGDGGVKMFKTNDGEPLAKKSKQLSKATHGVLSMDTIKFSEQGEDMAAFFGENQPKPSSTEELNPQTSPALLASQHDDQVQPGTIN
jgi:hypothetical protein